MELKDFIKQTLLDISGAIKETNEDNETNIIVNPKNVSGSDRDSVFAYLPGEHGGRNTRPMQKTKLNKIF